MKWVSGVSVTDFFGVVLWIFREFRGWNGLVGRGFLGKEQIV
jgi:hypothetical protein